MPDIARHSFSHRAGRLLPGAILATGIFAFTVRRSAVLAPSALFVSIGLAALACALWLRGDRELRVAERRARELEEDRAERARRAAELAEVRDAALEAARARALLDPADSMLPVLDDVLDLSRIESGQIQLASAPFDLLVTMDEVADALAARAAEKGVDLLVRCAPNSPTRFVGDQCRVRQLLLNLAGNALEFTASGYVLIEAECLEGTVTSARMQLSVHDSGIGIPAELVPRLFTHAGESNARRQGGTGLGLAIVRRLAERMGGSVGVTSVEGRGSVFRATLSLPIDASSPRAVSPPLRGAGRGVLIVDGCTRARALLAERLVEWGLVAEVAEGPDEALERLRAARADRRPYSLVLVEARPRGFDAQAFARAVRAQEGARPPALFSIAVPAPKGELPPAAGGVFDGHLSRPLRTSVLRAAIEPVLDRHAPAA